MIFITRTHHGDYLHEARVEIDDALSDLDAWEIVQSASPYTPGVRYNGSDSHERCVRDFAALRSGDISGVYSPHAGWVGGWSWTWIIRPDLAGLEIYSA